MKLVIIETKKGTEEETVTLLPPLPDIFFWVVPEGHNTRFTSCIDTETGMITEAVIETNPVLMEDKDNV